MQANGQRYQPNPSRFKTCLMEVPVPRTIMEGICVTKLLTNGKSKQTFLTLSKDKFTIYVTANKFKPGNIGNLSMINRPFLHRISSFGNNDDESSEMTVNIGSIERINEGQNTLRFELSRNAKGRQSRLASPQATKEAQNEASRSFSIIYSGEKTIDIILPAHCSTKRREIVTALNNLLDLYNASKLRVGNDVLLLRHIWNDVDKDQNDSINCTEFREILNRINVRKKKNEAEKMYNTFAKMIGLDRNERRNGLSFEQCVTILHKTKRDSGYKAKPVREIWYDLFGERMNNGKVRTRVSADTFKRKFMWQKQGEPNTTDEDVSILFKRLNRLELADVATNLRVNETNEGRFIDKDRFEAYLVSKENDIFDPAAARLDREKMTLSLSNYWINSSHNTYLTGDQLQSRSSVEMYLNALHRGCRCIEIDCFNGYRDSEGKLVPLVYHGKTITTKILFSDVIKGINLFLKNKPDCYPLILSLENHCSVPYQDSIADILESILGDRLYLPEEIDLFGPLPSPEELKGKVLIKGKRLTADLETQASYDTESDDDSEIEDEHRNNEAGGSTQPTKKEQHLPTPQDSNVSLKLSNMTIFHGIRLKTFEEHVQMSKDNMLSFNEAKGRRLCQNQVFRDEWVNYNKTHLSRVYPSGSRVDSSNFNPIPGWSTGSQLMALNFQTNDAYRRLNDGRFQQNGNCGYVLKPNLINDVTTSRAITLTIKVLTGTCLPKPNDSKRGECIDPYVQVCLFDIPLNGGKKIETVYYTRHESNNGFNPIFSTIHIDEERYKFKCRVENPDVAMLQFSVFDRDVTSDDFIGSSSVPVSCIREGYRSVQLYDSNHKRNGAFECASLLVEVTINQQGQQIKMW